MHGPADDPAREQIHHRVHVEPAFGGPEAGKASAPFAIGGRERAIKYIRRHGVRRPGPPVKKDGQRDPKRLAQPSCRPDSSVGRDKGELHNAYFSKQAAVDSGDQRNTAPCTSKSRAACDTVIPRSWMNFTTSMLNSHVNPRRSMTYLRLHSYTALGVFETGSRPSGTCQ